MAKVIHIHSSEETKAFLIEVVSLSGDDKCKIDG